ncbi:MAG: spore coat-associated protein camelysin [Alysiella sp.]|uniref:spore coat-associated protein camelysin n=1 Tax=Alysiella sp. TaxID=1872483 RepID=UPI0026DAD77B|nr:spore coat-associated protein camelysin [Alysiella sp.]MDO4433445.1 spore coat-associated protein camelysin [Alysiella sp.]
MKHLIVILSVSTLGGCLYADTPHGRFATIDLPVHSQSTVHKTVTVNAPAGTTVILNETPPPTIIYHDNLHRDCYFDKRIGQRVCTH